jgi:glutaredoxin
VTQNKRKTTTKAPAKAASRPAGKPAVNGATAAQKRLAAQRAMAAASGAQAARRKRMFYTVVAPIVAVIAIVAVFIVVKANSSSKSGNATTAAAASVTTQVTSVPVATLNTVGVGTVTALPTALTGAALTADSKPRVVYVGAEWCPYCAAMRWPLAVALSRFGTLTGLGQTKSSPTDTDPNTPTLSFQGSTYTSSTISLTATEIQDGNHNTINTLSTADEQLFTSVGQSSFPFIDIGGKYQIPVMYDPGSLDGKTHEQIAAALSNPSSSIAKDIDGSANVITAAICATTGNAPAAVCTAAGVVAAAKKLPGATG